MDKLEHLRKEIDILDDEIMKLLDKRFDIINDIKTYKKENHIQTLDTSRENEILNKANNFSHHQEIKNIYMQILSTSKEFQDQ